MNSLVLKVWNYAHVLRDLQGSELTRRYSAALEKLSRPSAQGRVEPAVLIVGREYQEEQFRLRS